MGGGQFLMSGQREKSFIENMTSDRKLRASREGPKYDASPQQCNARNMEQLCLRYCLGALDPLFL